MFRKCRWCAHLNDNLHGVPVYCAKCFHRADVARMDCTCKVCRRPSRRLVLTEAEMDALTIFVAAKDGAIT